jgi:hypothetical protein
VKEFDFLPRSFHEAARRRRRARRNMLHCAGLALALSGLHFVNASRLASAEACLAALRSNGAERQARQSRFVALTAARDQLENCQKVIDRLEDNAPVDTVIAEVSRLMSDSMAIRSLSIETGPASPPEGKKADPVYGLGPTRAVLVGMAATDVEVGIFFGRLTESPLFDDVSMSFSRETEVLARQMREFELQFVVRRVALEH